MRYIAHILLTTALLLTCSAIGLAQHTTKKKTRVNSVRNSKLRVLPKPVGATLACRDYITAGLLDERALSKPLPDYPEEARAKNISGVVIVQIMIDQSGDVVSARALSGPPLLLKSAVDAAYRAKFPVTKLSGQPIKVMGELKYDFVL